MNVAIPKIRFNNGQYFPLFGLGTWQADPGAVQETITDAIDIGYRHFDCAHIYENEKEIGEALAKKIKEGVVRRQDLYITSKLWRTFHHPSDVEPALKTTLKNLQLDYLDLYLIHWPFAFREDLFPLRDKKYVVPLDVDYIDTWKAMEEVNKKGLTKSIGVSNFSKRQIARILQIATIAPVTNQVVCTPYLNQQELLDFCRAKRITLTSFAPLGLTEARTGVKSIVNVDVFKIIGDKYNKTPAQVLLKYQVQRGIITIPNTVSRKRLKQNIAIFDFELAAEDMDTLNSLDSNNRRGVRLINRT